MCYLCTVTSSYCPDSADFLPFLTLGSTLGVDRELLPRSDDGCSGAIVIDDGFPFGGFSETQVYVSILVKVAITLQSYM